MHLFLQYSFSSIWQIYPCNQKLQLVLIVIYQKSLFCSSVICLNECLIEQEIIFGHGIKVWVTFQDVFSFTSGLFSKSLLLLSMHVCERLMMLLAEKWLQDGHRRSCRDGARFFQHQKTCTEEMYLFRDGALVSFILCQAILISFLSLLLYLSFENERNFNIIGGHLL